MFKRPDMSSSLLIISNEHEASDGRGLSQLQRSKYNYEMLNYVLDDWMPWHHENYDFPTIDIDRYYNYGNTET